MNITTENQKKRIEAEERHKVFLTFQKELEQEGVIPPSPALILRRYQYILEYASEILIGFFIGISSMILVFLVVNVILHIDF
ncbi:MAG: hypothetical protein IT393_05845 [Nitrospirae bacterium]|nr:hypothetical protein [Nitrospirota bacterium]